MSLSASRLKAAILGLTQSYNPPTWPAGFTAEMIAEVEAKQDHYAEELADIIVSEMQNATVIPTGLVAPGGGGPVTGTATLT